MKKSYKVGELTVYRLDNVEKCESCNCVPCIEYQTLEVPSERELIKGDYPNILFKNMAKNHKIIESMTKEANEHAERIKIYERVNKLFS